MINSFAQVMSLFTSSKTQLPINHEGKDPVIIKYAHSPILGPVCINVSNFEGMLQDTKAFAHTQQHI
jgi:hypothetical protein